MRLSSVQAQHDKTPKTASGQRSAQRQSGVTKTSMRTGVPLFLQAKLSTTPNPMGVVQRKCACGSPASSSSEECAACGGQKRLALQTKLKISEPGDSYEQEADRIADQVLAKSAHTGVSSVPPHIQRYAGQPTGQGDTIPASVGHVLAGSGRPLEPALRQDMEQRFGHDFSRVRVHSGGAAEQSAREVNAYAYTVGHNIVFGADRFAPATHEGRRLIAHELTHVVQQAGAARVRAGQSDETRGPSPISRQEAGDAQVQRKPGGKDACPKRERGETAASAKAPFELMELSPQQEWLIYGFGVGSSTIDPAKGDIEGLMELIVWDLAKGHFVYVTGQDPIEVLGYSDCHVSKANPNERLRVERAANFCAAYKLSLFDRLGSDKTFNQFISSCRAAPSSEFVASNATPEGRSQNRGVLIRVLPPSKGPTSSLAYDDKYGPTTGNCGTYLGVEDFLSREYSQNAYCACTHTPDDPNNNCVRKCLQSKMWSFLAANAKDLRSGNFIWCPTIWKHHRECYSECMCDKSFIDYVAFAPLCEIKTGCAVTGLTIKLFNPCMVPAE